MHHRSKLLLYGLFFIAFQKMTFANNGEILFSYPANITIDGQWNDWATISSEEIISIEGDVLANFKMAYNNIEQKLYFYVEVTDNEYQVDTSLAWYNNDAIALYLNPLHSEKASTCEMIIFNDQMLTLFQTDEDFNVILKDHIKIKSNRNKK